MQTDLEPAMTVRDVAIFLNVDEKTIYRLVTKGELPGFKVLGSWQGWHVDFGYARAFSGKRTKTMGSRLHTLVWNRSQATSSLY